MVCIDLASKEKESEMEGSQGHAAAKSLQSCPTLSDPMDCSLPCSSVHGIFQARVLEWGAIAFSVGDRVKYIKDAQMLHLALHKASNYCQGAS